MSANDLVLGIDEAGRGPLMGALVVAAVALTPAAARRLRRAGVVDSKRFGAGGAAHAARLALVRRIEACASWIGIDVADVETVDTYVVAGRLNELERERAARLVRAAPPWRRIVADGRHVFGPLRASFAPLTAVDGAEDRFVAVAAASLCAKVRRDELWACVTARYRHDFGDIAGMGYTNPATRAFARAYRRRQGALPPEARLSWPWPAGARAHRVTAAAPHGGGDVASGSD